MEFKYFIRKFISYKYNKHEQELCIDILSVIHKFYVDIIISQKVGRFSNQLWMVGKLEGFLDSALNPSLKSILQKNL